MIETDFLIIGSGIAGLTFALKVARHSPNTTITIVTKANEDESNTKYAQGGIAVVMDPDNDSYLQHIEDTLKAGDGLCKKNIVEMVVKEGPKRLQEIISWGVSFDETGSGQYELGREGGHSVNRIIHNKDITGLEVEQTLLKQVAQSSNIKLLPYHFTIDLITQHHMGQKITRYSSDITCYGAYVMNLKTSKIDKILSKITELATGGAGQVYSNTTNPVIATGDGIAMAYRAKAIVKDMEFIQFHPTALYNRGESPAFLISEAVRGKGAILRTQNGKSFMDKYDKRASLASRDIVARAIDAEMKIYGEDFVYLDCQHLNKEEFIHHFPNIYEKCRNIGIDVTQEMIPVVPAAHYVCGGIQVAINGKTTIKNLYACGECAYTGLHGANRLASNSLLEALVFAHNCYQNAIKNVRKISIQKNVPDWNAQGTIEPKEQVLITHNRKELQTVMSNYVGIVRSHERLQRAMKRFEIIYLETKHLYDTTILSPQLCELRNLINIGYLIIKQSLLRKENRGVFFNSEFAIPNKEIS